MNSITQATRIGLIITILRLLWSTAPSTVFAAPPISYGRQIAPLFALRCAGCHGVSNPSSNFRVTQFASLRAGGNIGDEVVPSHPETSVLLEFIEGKRGPGQRMPQNSNPLSPSQIALVRQWISEGAENDGATSPCFDLRIPRITAERNHPIQLRTRITVPALVIISLRDPGLGRELYVDEGSVSFPKEAANVAAPGEWISRTLTREQDWPASVSLSVRLQYPSGVPNGSVLIAGTGGVEQSTSKLIRSVCAPL